MNSQENPSASGQKSGHKGSTHAAWRIVAVYAVFSGLWILFSDKAVAQLFAAPFAITLASMIKGWFFVAVTSILLFSLIRRMVNELQESENALQEAQRIAGVGSYVLNLHSGQWKSSVVCDKVLGIGDGYVRSIPGWVALVHPGDRGQMEEYLRKEVLGRGQTFDREYRIVRPVDGVERWVHGLGQLSRDAKGDLVELHGTIQDISDKKYAEMQMESARNTLQATLDALPDLLFEVDQDGRIHNYHSHRSDLLAAAPEVFLGRLFTEILPPDVAATCFQAIQESAVEGFSTGRAYALVLPQGGEHWFELSVAPMAGLDRGKRHFILIARDITERKSVEQKLQVAARVFSHAREGIIITSPDGTILDVNEAFTRIAGYLPGEAIGRTPRMLRSDRQDAAFYVAMWRNLLKHGYWSGEIWNRCKDGRVIAELMTISAVHDAQGQTVQYVAFFSDITALKEHQHQIEHIAHFDALTDLPNRLLLADRLQQAMKQAQRSHQPLAVAYLDLDGFKSINDSHGQDVGDQLLIALAKRMKQTLRDGDSLARIGGDEFVAVLVNLEQMDACRPLLDRLLNAASEPVSVGKLTLQVSASLGVTFYPQQHVLDADQLLRQADQAMYQAKLSGKNRYHQFDAEKDSSIRAHHESLAGIEQALRRHEFVLYYQPKVHMRTGQIVGAEALIRWQHPEKGLLSPITFLPVIEDHPLSVAIGEWVIDTALRQHASWLSLGLDVPVSVNVGARQLQQSDFVSRLQAILAQHPQLNPSCLSLEILETSALEDMAQVSGVIEACKRIGVAFALDDFGTGYSSLTYLKRLHVSELKIDQSFVRDMLDDPDNLAILEGVIGLAKAFRRAVIAEGVETVEHGALLLQLGCELAQGYGIARPMPADALPAWAAAWQPDPAWRECV